MKNEVEEKAFADRSTEEAEERRRGQIIKSEKQSLVMAILFLARSSHGPSTARPGTHKSRAGKSRVAPVGMTNPKKNGRGGAAPLQRQVPIAFEIAAPLKHERNQRRARKSA